MSNSLSPRAGARMRWGRSRYRLAGGAAAELINILGAQHTERNFRTWAFYCYHHDPELLLDRAYELNSLHRITGRPRNPVTAFQRWLTDTFGKDAR